MITTHLLTKNNEATIERCLKSLLPLNGDIVVGDLQSNDATINICKKYGARVFHLEQEDRSACRNDLLARIKSPWLFYIEPWEVFAAGHDATQGLNPDVYFIQVFQGDVVTKEVRLWHSSLGVKFIQPVFEVPNNKSETELPNVIVYANQIAMEDKLPIIENWLQAKPLSKEPYYYKAFVLLGQKKYQQFLIAAQEYLFREKQGMPTIMMQYYTALVQLYMGDTAAAARGAVACISTKPLMAEFWCLLGDTYYKVKQYRKAIFYYENAMILGQRRFRNDLWPIEISKYKKHPMKMIENCHQMIANSKIIIRA